MGPLPCHWPRFCPRPVEINYTGLCASRPGNGDVALAMHVAVIGSGRWCRPHLEALSGSPHVAAITLVGRNPNAVTAVAAAYPGVRPFVGCWSEVVADPKIDLVDIVVPHHLHHPVATAAIDAGKHVICEKPGSLSLTDWDALGARAAAADRRFLVIQNQLYDPLVQRIGQVVREGLLGRPFLLVENNYTAHAASYRQDGWRTRRDLAGGGVLIDGGYHMVYKHLDWLAGISRPVWVDASTAQLNIFADGTLASDRGEDFVSYTVAFEGPLRINASHAWTLSANPLRPRLGLLAGSQATLEWVDSADAPLLLHTPGKAAFPLESPAADERKESLKKCIVDYVEAIQQQRQPRYGSSALARRTLQLILGVYQASREGCRVMLP